MQFPMRSRSNNFWNRGRTRKRCTIFSLILATVVAAIREKAAVLINAALLRRAATKDRVSLADGKFLKLFTGLVLENAEREIRRREQVLVAFLDGGAQIVEFACFPDIRSQRSIPSQEHPADAVLHNAMHRLL